jgi:hypothetical protein
LETVISSQQQHSWNAKAGLVDDSQQTGKYFHAIGHRSVEEDHDTDAREAKITPERVRNERWTVVFDLMVHPTNKCRNCGESDNQ